MSKRKNRISLGRTCHMISAFCHFSLCHSDSCNFNFNFNINSCHVLTVEGLVYRSLPGQLWVRMLSLNLGWLDQTLYIYNISFFSLGFLLFVLGYSLKFIRQFVFVHWRWTQPVILLFPPEQYSEYCIPCLMLNKHPLILVDTAKPPK